MRQYSSIRRAVVCSCFSISTPGKSTEAVTFRPRTPTNYIADAFLSPEKFASTNQ